MSASANCAGKPMRAAIWCRPRGRRWRGMVREGRSGFFSPRQTLVPASPWPPPTPAPLRRSWHVRASAGTARRPDRRARGRPRRARPAPRSASARKPWGRRPPGSAARLRCPAGRPSRCARDRRGSRHWRCCRGIHSHRRRAGRLRGHGLGGGRGHLARARADGRQRRQPLRSGGAAAGKGGVGHQLAAGTCAVRRGLSMRDRPQRHPAVAFRRSYRGSSPCPA